MNSISGESMMYMHEFLCQWFFHGLNRANKNLGIAYLSAERLCYTSGDCKP